MKCVIPPFEDVSEGAMAFLASRPEDWRLWSIEEFELQSWEFFPKSKRHNLISTRFRGLLSLLQKDSTHWSAKSYLRSSSPSQLVISLMKVPGSTLAKREWLKWLRGLGDDSEINGIISELGKLEFGKLGPELKVVLKTVLARRKDSKGRFEAKHWVLRAELWSKQKRLFRGSPEALAEYLCI